MTPLAIEVALTVRQELASRHEEADRLRRQHVERARYEADLAQRRFLKVDPDNRLVADALEADWNGKLRALAAAQEAYEKATAADASAVTDAERAELMALATDFPRLWRDPRTQMKKKKRMLRLMIDGGSGIFISSDSAPKSVITSLAGFADARRPHPPGGLTEMPAARK